MKLEWGGGTQDHGPPNPDPDLFSFREARDSLTVREEVSELWGQRPEMKQGS